jgi:hypothetical protein
VSRIIDDGTHFFCEKADCGLVDCNNPAHYGMAVAPAPSIASDEPLCTDAYCVKCGVFLGGGMIKRSKVEPSQCCECESDEPRFAPRHCPACDTTHAQGPCPIASDEPRELDKDFICGHELRRVYGGQLNFAWCDTCNTYRCIPTLDAAWAEAGDLLDDGNIEVVAAVLAEAVRLKPLLGKFPTEATYDQCIGKAAIAIACALHRKAGGAT